MGVAHMDDYAEFHDSVFAEFHDRWEKSGEVRRERWRQDLCRRLLAALEEWAQQKPEARTDDISDACEHLGYTALLLAEANSEEEKAEIRRQYCEGDIINRPTDDYKFDCNALLSGPQSQLELKKAD
jgi:hypothetical protein